jgi:hypothetical protein
MPIPKGVYHPPGIPQLITRTIGSYGSRVDQMELWANNIMKILQHVQKWTLKTGELPTVTRSTLGFLNFFLRDLRKVLRPMASAIEKPSLCVFSRGQRAGHSSSWEPLHHQGKKQTGKCKCQQG